MPRFLRNVLSNWAGYLVATIAGFLVSPLIVNKLGDTGYGVWTLIISVTGYMGLLDLGVRASIGRFVARYMTLGDQRGVNRTLSTAVLILMVGGASAFLVTLVLQSQLDWLGVDPAFREQARWAMVIAGLNIGLALPAGAFGGVLFAMERFDVTGAITVVGSIVRSSLVALALHSGHGIIALSLIALTVSLAESTAWVILAKSLYPQLRLFETMPAKAAIHELLSFSMYRFVWVVANQMILYSDAIVISVFLSSAAITPFAIAATLITYGRTMVTLAVDPLAPSAARNDATGNLDGLRQQLIFGAHLALLVAVPVCIGFVFLGRQFLTLWMGPQHVASAAILTALATPQVFSLSQYASVTILVCMARHKVLAWIALCEAISNVILSVILVKKMGVIGVAWGTAIPQAIWAVVLAAYTLRMVKMGAFEYVRKALLRPLLCAIPAAMLGYTMGRAFEQVSWPVFGAEASLVALSYATLVYWFCLTASQRQQLQSRLPAIPWTAGRKPAST